MSQSFIGRNKLLLYYRLFPGIRVENYIQQVAIALKNTSLTVILSYWYNNCSTVKLSRQERGIPRSRQIKKRDKFLQDPYWVGTKVLIVSK